jgi:hypothetical protein
LGLPSKPPSLPKLAASSTAAYSRTLAPMLKTLHAAQVVEARGKSLRPQSIAAASASRAKLPPSRTSFKKARSFLASTRYRPFLRTSLFAFDRLMALLDVDPLDYYSSSDRAGEAKIWKKMAIEAPPKHARSVPLEVWREAIASVAAKARSGYRMLRDDHDELVGASQDSPARRRLVQDVRAWPLLLCCLLGAWRRSDLSGAHVTSYLAQHLHHFLQAPGAQSEVVILNPKGKKFATSVFGELTDHPDFNVSLALGLWLRVRARAMSGSASFLYNASHSELVPLFLTVGARSWGHVLTAESAAKAMNALLDREIAPVLSRELVVSEGIVMSPSSIPQPSFVARQSLSSHSFRHSGITLWMLNGLDSERLRIQARDSVVASLDPYLHQAPPPLPSILPPP